MFLFFNLANAFIHLLEPTIIHIYNDPQTVIHLKNGTARLKRLDKTDSGYKPEIVAFLSTNNRKYEIVINNGRLIYSETEKELIGVGNLKIKTPNSYWDIINYEYGYYIQQDDLCLTKGKLDEMHNGFTLILSECLGGIDQVWDFQGLDLDANEMKEAVIQINEAKIRIDSFRKLSTHSNKW